MVRPVPQPHPHLPHLLFGLLDSVRVAFNASSNLAGYDRMVVASRLSITQMLPLRL